MPGNGLVQSLARGLGILDAVAARGEASLQELVEATGLKKPTIHNLARTLITSGYLKQEHPGSAYSLGSAPTRLALASQQQRLHVLGEAALHNLQRALPMATITLSQHVDGNIAVVQRATPQQCGVVTRPLGMLLHPYSNASPLLFQALWSDDQRDAFRLAHPFSELGGPLWKNEAQLEAYLAEVREQDCALLHSQATRVPLAVPVRDHNGHILAALGMALSAPQAIPYTDVEGAKAATLAAATHITEALAA